MSSAPGGWKARTPPLEARSVPLRSCPWLPPTEPSGDFQGAWPSKGSGSEGTEWGHVQQRAPPGQEAEAQLAKALMVTETLDRTRNWSLLGSQYEGL